MPNACIVNDLDPLDTPANGQRPRYVDREKFPAGNRISSKCYVVTLKQPMIGANVARITAAALFRTRLTLCRALLGRVPGCRAAGQLLGKSAGNEQAFPIFGIGSREARLLAW